MLLKFLEICGMIAAGLMIKYREQIGDSLGDAEWMRYVGGVYNFIIILAIFLFFWSIAALTGTQHILFAPLTWFFSGMIR